MWWCWCLVGCYLVDAMVVGCRITSMVVCRRDRGDGSFVTGDYDQNF